MKPEDYQKFLDALDFGACVAHRASLSILCCNSEANRLLSKRSISSTNQPLKEQLPLSNTDLAALENQQQLDDGYSTRLSFSDDGDEIWYQMCFKTLDKTTDEVLISIEDITETEKKFKELELLKAAVEHSIDAIVITDANEADPRITFANSAFEKLTGYSQEEFMGRNPKFLQGPKTDRSKIEQLKASIYAGEPCRVFTFNYRKSGEPYLLEWVTSPVRNDAGEIVNWIALQRDVTERVRLAKEREERENRIMAAMINGQEMERQRVAEDLHDSLGQMISVTNIEIGHLKQHLLQQHPEDEAAAERIQNIRKLMEEVSQETRMISRHLLPQMLNDLGMIAAVQNMASKMKATVEQNIQIRKMGAPFRLDPMQEIAVFRIVQEAITNAVKHAEAENVFILFNFRKDNFEVVVRDDGTGMDDARVAERRQKSMGLNNMETRAKLINGKLTISSEADEGTAIKLRLPMEHIDVDNDDIFPEEYLSPAMPTFVPGADYRMDS